MKPLAILLIVLFLAVTSCSNQDVVELRHYNGDFDDLFELVGRLVLEEPDNDVIGEPRLIRHFHDGRFLVVDVMTSQVRIHNEDGRFLKMIGHPGTGPGEFRGPYDATVDHAGGFQIIEAEGARLSQFDSSGAVLNVVNLPASGHRLIDFDNQVIVGMREASGANFGFLRADGSFRAFYEWPPEIMLNRYWRSIALDYAAVSEDYIFVVNSLQYPVWQYSQDGGERREFVGHPPASWQEPTPMPPGQQDRSQIAEWLNTFTVIAGLDVVTSKSQDYVLVSHGAYDPATRGGMRGLFRLEPYAVSMYSMDGMQVAEDIRLPGRIMHADSLVYVLSGVPPQDWTLSIFRLRNDVRVQGLVSAGVDSSEEDPSK